MELRFSFGKMYSRARRRHLKLLPGSVQDQISKFQKSLKFMTPAGNFFEPWDLPRLHPGRSTGPLLLENEGFLILPPIQRKY